MGSTSPALRRLGTSRDLAKPAKSAILRPTQGNLDLAVGTARRAADDAARAYAKDGDAGAFSERMIDLMKTGHTRAAVIGRQRAGDFAPEESDDAGFAELIVEGEQPFLDAFAGDLRSGRYVDEDGTLDLAAISRRAQLYPARMTGTANETFVLASGDDEIDWVLGEPETGHCEDCPDIAAGNPYTAETLPSYPGDNSTSCLFQCRCSLERADGMTAFSIPE